MCVRLQLELPTEVGDEDAFDYTMNPWQALEYAPDSPILLRNLAAVEAANP